MADRLPEAALTCACGAGCTVDIAGGGQIDEGLTVIFHWLDVHKVCPSRFLSVDVLEVPDDVSEIDG